MIALAPRLRRVRRRLLVHRRGLAALAAAGAVFTGLQAAAPTAPATTPVWTAARALPGGHVLERSDLRQVAFAPASAPAELATPDDLVGRTLAAPVVRGAPFSRRSVLGEGLLAGHPGLAAVPVRITDPQVAGLLRVGDRVDLVATSAQAPDEARLLVRDAIVLTVPDDPFEPVSTTLSGRLLVLGISLEAVGRVVAAQVTAFVTVVWTG